MGQNPVGPIQGFVPVGAEEYEGDIVQALASVPPGFTILQYWPSGAGPLLILLYEAEVLGQAGKPMRVVGRTSKLAGGQVLDWANGLARRSPIPLPSGHDPLDTEQNVKDALELARTGRLAGRAVPTFPIVAGGVIRTAGREGWHVRPFAVVEVEPGKRRAFYMSTGTGGQTETGEWVGFGGMARDGWFIKAVDQDGKRIPKYAKVVSALSALLGDNAADAEARLRQRPHFAYFSEGDDAWREDWMRRGEGLPDDKVWFGLQRELRQKMAETRDALNRFLAKHGAVLPWQGELRADAAARAANMPTFLGSGPGYRAEFNPKLLPRPTEPRLANILEKRWAELVNKLPPTVALALPRVTWGYGRHRHFKTKRGYAVTLQSEPGSFHLLFAPKTDRASADRQQGLVLHELGHVLDMHFGYENALALLGERPRFWSDGGTGPERKADFLAEAFFGVHVHYDRDDVQTIGGGTRPRPARLGA